MIRRAAIALLLIALGACLGVGAGAVKWRRSTADIFDAKRALILNRAKDMPPGGVLVIGDSIVERQRLERICGLPALNAGMGSARIGDAAPIVAPLLTLTKPSRIVVAFGPNHFLNGNDDDLDAFAAAMDNLLSQAPPRPIVVGMTAPATHPANDAMRRLAEKHGGAFVEGVPAEMTEDGLHLNRDGLGGWKRRVEAAC